jgi:hypothetical protein
MLRRAGLPARLEAWLVILSFETLAKARSSG